MNNFYCKRCGVLVYHPDRGDYDYQPESGLCRACYRAEWELDIIRQSEAETEEYINKRRILG